MNTTNSKPSRPRANSSCSNPASAWKRAFFWFNENTNVNAKTGKPYVDPVKLKWFRNTKFRQACSYAIDREAIIKSVYSGRGDSRLWLCDARQQKMV